MDLYDSNGKKIDKASDNGFMNLGKERRQDYQVIVKDLLGVNRMRYADFVLIGVNEKQGKVEMTIQGGLDLMIKATMMMNEALAEAADQNDILNSADISVRMFLSKIKQIHDGSLDLMVEGEAEGGNGDGNSEPDSGTSDKN